MKRVILFSFLVAVCGGLININAQTIKTHADTYIFSGGENTPEADFVRGDNDTLVARFNDSNTYRRMAFLKFGLPESLDANSISGAKLYIYGSFKTLVELEGGVSAYQPLPEYNTLGMDVFDMNYFADAKGDPTYDWDEATFTHSLWNEGAYRTNSRNPDNTANNYGGVAGTKIASLLLTDFTNGEEDWYIWELPAENIISQIGKAYTLQLCSDKNSKAAYFFIHSKENPSGNAAYLEILTEQSNISLPEIIGLECNLYGKTLSVSNVETQSELLVTDLAGKIVLQACINGDYEYTFQNDGIYIVSVNNGLATAKQKIIVR